jgi:hypothetical protein
MSPVSQGLDSKDGQVAVRFCQIQQLRILRRPWHANMRLLYKSLAGDIHKVAAGFPIS